MVAVSMGCLSKGVTGLNRYRHATGVGWNPKESSRFHWNRKPQYKGTLQASIADAINWLSWERERGGPILRTVIN